MVRANSRDQARWLPPDGAQRARTGPEDGIPLFDQLRYGRQTEAGLFAFDLLELGGKDLRAAPLEERKRTLAKLLRKAGWALHFNNHIDEPGDVVFRHACKLGFEGIVSKRLGSAYHSGRSRDWIKSKNPAAPRSNGRPRRTGVAKGGGEPANG